MTAAATSRRSARLAFPVALALVPVLFIGGLEVAARRGRAERDTVWLAAHHAAINLQLFEGGPLLKRSSSFDMTGAVPGCVGRVETNDLGMRMGPVAREAPPGVLRVACLGDSVTFGWCVPEPESYPRQLEGILRTRLGVPVEVLNLGIPGSRSDAAVRLMRLDLLGLAPDVVILGHGFNDSAFARPAEASSEGVGSVRRALRRSALYRSMVRGLARVTLRARPVAAERLGSRGELRYNTMLSVQGARRLGAEPVVADLDLPNFWAHDVLELVARNQGAPFLCGRAMLDAHRPLPPAPAGLRPAGTEPLEGRRELLVRARAAVGPPSVVGDRPELGGLVPGKIVMRDDGRDGDERAGDGVWSALVPLPAAAATEAIDVTFAEPGPVGDWSRPAIPGMPAAPTFHVFHRVVAGDGRTVTPVLAVGEIPYADLAMQGDPVHLDGDGLRLLAEEMAKIVEPMLRERASRS